MTNDLARNLAACHRTAVGTRAPVGHLRGYRSPTVRTSPCEGRAAHSATRTAAHGNEAGSEAAARQDTGNGRIPEASGGERR